MASHFRHTFTAELRDGTTAVTSTRILYYLYALEVTRDGRTSVRAWYTGKITADRAVNTHRVRFPDDRARLVIATRLPYDSDPAAAARDAAAAVTR